jgi:hypothetical protein
MRLGRASTVTNAQREELWRRYKAGETILGIGRALGDQPLAGSLCSPHSMQKYSWSNTSVADHDSCPPSLRRST